MSGGTPRSTFVRQRHSWGYASSSEDLEDDACSKLTLSSPPISRAKSWVEVLENVVWIASSLFIIYFGDWHYNFIHLLLHDDRIRRTPLYLGLVGVLLNVACFFYASLSSWGLKKYNEKWEVIGDYALQFVTLGFITFCLLTVALWPIWKFLTLPLVFTLFMAGMVLSLLSLHFAVHTLHGLHHTFGFFYVDFIELGERFGNDLLSYSSNTLISGRFRLSKAINLCSVLSYSG